MTREEFDEAFGSTDKIFYWIKLYGGKKMTLFEKCRELYPNGKLDKDGLPPLCPCMLEGMNLDKQDLTDCNIRKCKDCWNREFKDVIEGYEE